MNKWLEKYSNGDIVQQNYNDVSVSLPEGFIGMGYNTKGRNYSPAWGGQFEEGGVTSPQICYDPKTGKVVPCKPGAHKTWIFTENPAITAPEDELPGGLTRVNAIKNNAFTKEAEDLKNYLIKNQPGEDIEIYPTYKSDKNDRVTTTNRGKTLNEILRGSDAKTRLAFMAHHGSNLFGSPAGNLGKKLQATTYDNCYLGSCWSGDIAASDEFKGLSNFNFRPGYANMHNSPDNKESLPWFGVNPNKNSQTGEAGVNNAFFNTTYDIDTLNNLYKQERSVDDKIDDLYRKNKNSEIYLNDKRNPFYKDYESLSAQLHNLRSKVESAQKIFVGNPKKGREYDILNPTNGPHIGTGTRWNALFLGDNEFDDTPMNNTQNRLRYEEGGNVYPVNYVPQAQKGRQQPTSADSSRLYNRAIEIGNYYKSKGYTKLQGEPSPSEARNELKKSINAIEKAKKEANIPEAQLKDFRRNAETIGKSKIQRAIDYEKNKKAKKFPKYLKDLKDTRDINPSPYHYKYKGKMYKSHLQWSEDNVPYRKLTSDNKYYNPINANQFGQRELSFGFIDYDSPMPLYDKRIVPQNLTKYEKVGQDRVELYEYDPLAIKPFVDRTPKERIQWEELYGNNPSSTTSTETTTQQVVQQAPAQPTQIANPPYSVNIGGDSVFGPGNSLIGFMNKGKFTPITQPRFPKGDYDYIFGPANSVIGRNYNGQFYSEDMPNQRGGVNQPDLDLLNNPEALKKYVQNKGLKFAMGGSLPGSVGFTYARTNNPAPSNGPYAKKTMPSAQDGWVTKAANAEFSCAANPRSNLNQSYSEYCNPKKGLDKDEYKALKNELSSGSMKDLLNVEEYYVLKNLADNQNRKMGREDNAYSKYFDQSTGLPISNLTNELKEEGNLRATNRMYPGRKNLLVNDVYQGVLKDYNITTPQTPAQTKALLEKAYNIGYAIPKQKDGGSTPQAQKGKTVEISDPKEFAYRNKINGSRK